MHGKNVLIFLKRLGNTYRYCLLTDTTKPFTDFILPQQDEHFFFYEAGPEQFFVEFPEKCIGIFFAIKNHSIAQQQSK